jgi:tetratricopeptide (TPR) repeat protein
MTRPGYKSYLFLLAGWPLAFEFLDKTTALLLADAVVMILWLKLRLDSKGKKEGLYQVPGMLPLFLFGLYIACQMIPLPPALLKWISPNTWKLYHQTVWVVRPEAWMPLSVATLHTLQEFFLYFLCAVLYFLTIQALTERERIHITVNLLAILAGLFSILEVLVSISSSGSGSERVLAGHGSPLSLWHYQSWTSWIIGIFPLLLGLFLAFRPRIQYGTVKEKILQFYKHPTSQQYLLHFLLILLIVSGIIFGRSVAGPVTGLLLFAGMVLATRGDRKNGVFLLVVAVLVVGAGIFLSRGGFLVGSGRNVVQQTALQPEPLSLARDYAVLGTGFGTYRDVLPRYQTEDSTGRWIPSDLLEFFGEGGVIGFLLGGWFLFSLLKNTFPQWVRRQNRTAVYLYPAALAGLAAELINGFLHLNAPGETATVCFFLAGVAVSTAHIRAEGKKLTDLALLKPSRRPWGEGFALGLLVLGLVCNGGILLGQHNLARRAGEATQMVSAKQIDRDLSRLEKQQVLDPLDPGYPYALALAHLATEDYRRAVGLLGKALRLAPLNGEYAQTLGMVLSHLGQDKKAEKLLRGGLQSDPFAAARHKEFALWLFSKGKKEEGLSQIAYALSLSPEKTPGYLAMMDLYGISKDRMRQVLPANALSYQAFGNYLLAKGQKQRAEGMYRQAIEYARKGESDRELFWQMYQYYMSSNRIDDALQVVLAGIRVFPREADFRVLAAGIYERMGISFRAIEEYRNALLLDPDNRSAAERLAVLSDQ